MRIQLSLSLFAIILYSLSSCRDNDSIEPTIEGVLIDGKEYATLKIGSQIWTTTNYEGQGGVSYDKENSRPYYGKYYTNAELATIPIPEGWRIPTQEDYAKLAQFYEIEIPSNGNHTESIKSLMATTHWEHVIGTNTSGFNAYPAGYAFGSISPIEGEIAEFWTSEGTTLSIQEGADFSTLRILFYQSDNSPDFRFNVRFVKN